MNVCWVHGGGSEFASYRYRAEIPSKELAGRFATSINQGLADVAIFSKPSSKDLEVARQCKKEGTKIITDICDDHFNNSGLGPVYKKMVSMSDAVCCPTEKMAEIINLNTGKDAVTIPDPYEVTRTEPHAVGYKTLWFGHQSNIQDLVQLINSGDYLGEVRACTGYNNILSWYVLWSLENLKKELNSANTVLLPTRSGAEYKSANRLINAVMSGCFVVCSSHPSHNEFRRFVWVGKMETGLKWLWANQSELNDMVREGQDHIERNYSPSKVGDLWKTLIESL